MINMKIVSTSAIFVITVIGIIVLAGILVFWRFMNLQNASANEASCKAKQFSYCSSLINGENKDWEEIPPKEGCEKFGIVKPSKDECERILK